MKANANQTLSISQQISSIYQHLCDTVGEGLKVVREKPVKGSSCAGIIAVYRQADLDGQNCDRPAKVSPEVRYAFYPGTYHPDRLESVAIYGGDAMTRCGMLRRHRTLFGYRIHSLQVEWGRRPFVDVRLRV